MTTTIIYSSNIKNNAYSFSPYRDESYRHSAVPPQLIIKDPLIKGTGNVKINKKAFHPKGRKAYAYRVTTQVNLLKADSLLQVREYNSDTLFLLTLEDHVPTYLHQVRFSRLLQRELQSSRL